MKSILGNKLRRFLLSLPKKSFEKGLTGVGKVDKLVNARWNEAHEAKGNQATRT